MKRIFVATAGIVTILLVVAYASSLVLTSSTVPTAVDEPVEDSSIQAQSTDAYRSYTFNDIAQTGRPQFLNGYATWCPYCKVLMPDRRILREKQAQLTRALHLREFRLRITLRNVLRAVPVERCDIDVHYALYLSTIIRQIDRGEILWRNGVCILDSHVAENLEPATIRIVHQNQ